MPLSFAFKFASSCTRILLITDSHLWFLKLPVCRPQAPSFSHCSLVDMITWCVLVLPLGVVCFFVIANLLYTFRSSSRLYRVPFPDPFDLISVGSMLRLKLQLLPYTAGKQIQGYFRYCSRCLITSVVVMYATLCRRCSSAPPEAIFFCFTIPQLHNMLPLWSLYVYGAKGSSWESSPRFYQRTCSQTTEFSYLSLPDS